jgi:quinol monooxygenase YgiN
VKEGLEFMIKVIAKSFTKENQIEKVLELAKELVEATVQEQGCISYEMYQDEKDPKILIMVEEWETIEALNNHMASEHFIRIVPQMNEYRDQKSELNICKRVL